MSDRFARIPERVKRKRARGELSFDEHAVLVSLVEDADYRTGEAVGTLRSLADAWGWTRSTRQLSRVLHALREQGEIAFGVDERQRKPWCIRVIGDGFGLDCDMTATSDPPPMSQSVRHARSAARPQTMNGSGIPLRRDCDTRFPQTQTQT